MSQIGIETLSVTERNRRLPLGFIEPIWYLSISRYRESEMPYSSSLTDREGEIIEPLLPSQEAHPTAAMVKTTNPGWSLVSTEERVQLVWLTSRLTTLFHRILALQTVADCGSPRPSHDGFAWESPATRKKKPCSTTLLLIDSQAVKNTCTASVESKGFCFYKATNGIKRHLAVDTLGFPFFIHCTPCQRVRWPRINWDADQPHRLL